MVRNEATRLAAFRRFGPARDGNVAIVFALALLPLVAFMGASVDYTMASNVRAKMQKAVDAAALATSRDSASLSANAFKRQARAMFDANFALPSGVELTAFTPTRNGDTVHIEATATVPTSLLKAVHIKTMEVAAVTQATRSARKIEVVLALDNTGSMADRNKMANLKRAANRLIDTMRDAASRPDQVKIGIVPFGTTVRFDPADYASADFIDFSGNLDREAGNTRRTTEIDRRTWQGCVWDRDQPYDVVDGGVKPGDRATQHPALQNCNAQENNLATIQPLTTDFNGLRRTIAAMTPGGNTNVTIGVSWGMALLSAGAPFTQAAPATDTDVEKFLIVLTDGMNTQDRWFHQSCNNSNCDNYRIDARTTKACDAARSMATVYTVRVIDGNEVMLKNCASDPDKFKNVRDASELEPVFQQIANEIVSLRLTS